MTLIMALLLTLHVHAGEFTAWLIQDTADRGYECMQRGDVLGAWFWLSECEYWRSREDWPV